MQPAGGQRHQFALASRAVVVCGQEEARHSRGRLVDDRQLAEAAGVPEPRDRGELRVHLQPRGAAGEEQVGEAGLRGDGPVDQEGVVDQDALGTPFDREPGRGRVAAHQRRFDAEVADDLQVGCDTAVGVEGARGRRAAHGQLRDVRRGGVEGAGRRHCHVPVQADAAVREAGQQRAVFLADGDQGVLDLEVARCALQLGRLHEGGGGEAVDCEIGGGGDAAAVLQGGDAAVDGRDRAAERVEGGHQGVAAVALGLAPAVRLDLDDAAVAQDGAPGEGRPEEQAADDLGRELVLDEVEEAVALGHRRIPSEVPGVERREVAAAQVPPVRLRFRIGVAGELERGVREDGGGRQGRPGQEGLDHGRRHVGAHQGLEAPVGADREVARVRLRLGQEARAGDGVVDLRLGPPRRPVLREGGRELGVQLRPGVEQRIGLGRGVIGREVHVAQGICNLLIHFGPRVEVEQRGDDLGVDLAAVVVAGQGRGDGRGHRAAGGVVGQLARHVGRDLRLVPVGHQLAGDEGQHLRLVLELGQVQGVDGGGDRCARFRLRVGLAAGVAVRLDEDGVVQVLEAGGQGAGHGQVPQHIAAPEQVEGRATVPGLAVAQRHRRRDGGVRLGRGVVGGDGRRDCGVRLDAGVVGREGCCDGGVPLGRRFEGRQRIGDGGVPLDRRFEGHQRRRDCGVRLDAGVVGREGCRNCGVPLDRRAVGHQRIGDGLGRLCRGAVIGQLSVRVALGFVDGRHHGDGDFGSRVVVGQGRGDGVVGLLRGVRIAAEAQGPVVVGQGDAQGARGVQVTDLIGPGQQVPGHVPQPGGGVDQVGGPTERGDLRQDAVDGRLQGQLQRVEVSCRGEGPGVLEGQDLRVMAIQPGVPQGQRGVQSRLVDEGEQRRCDELAHVRGRGPESHSGVEVAGADQGEQSGGDGLGDVACRLAGRHVQGQLVHDALERVRGCDAGQRCVVGAGHSAVHCCRGGMVAELQVHPSRGALAVDLDLEGVQGGLAGLGGEAQGQAGVDGREAGSVGRDEALRSGEVAGQGVGGEVRGCRQGGHLALQGRDGCGVRADVGGVLGACLQGRVGRENRGQLSRGDALQLSPAAP